MTKYYIDRWMEELTDGEVQASDNILEMRQLLGDEKFNVVDEGAKSASKSIIAFVRNQYNQTINKVHHTGICKDMIPKLTGGRDSNADLVLETTRLFDLVDDALGASMKFCAQDKKGSPIKLHSPSIHTLIGYVHNANPDSKIHVTFREITKDGIEKQKKVIEKHDALLLKTFGIPFRNRAKDWCKYEYGNLSQAALSWMRDDAPAELRAIYDEMSAHNLQMNRLLAEAFYNELLTIKQTKSQEVLETLLRDISNTHVDGRSLPTFLVLTEVAGGFTTTIRDSTKAMDYYLRMHSMDIELIKKPGTARMQIGPGSLGFDVRPTATRDPFGFAVNFHMKNTAFRNGV